MLLRVIPTPCSDNGAQWRTYRPFDEDAHCGTHTHTPRCRDFSADGWTDAKVSIGRKKHTTQYYCQSMYTHRSCIENTVCIGSLRMVLYCILSNTISPSKVSHCKEREETYWSLGEESVRCPNECHRSDVDFLCAHTHTHFPSFLSSYLMTSLRCLFHGQAVRPLHDGNEMNSIPCSVAWMTFTIA